jgi:uncharacterized membrane protein
MVASGACLGVVVAITSYRFVFVGLDTAFPSMGLPLENAYLWFMVHVVASPVSLAVGVLLLWPGMRSRAPGLHRWSGRVYALSVLVGGLSAVAMAPGANGGWLAEVGFTLVGLVWIGVTGYAVYLARTRQFAAHRRWMIRSYALTFASITLRLQLLPFQLAGISYLDMIPYLVWTSWPLNALIAELWLRRPLRKPTVTAKYTMHRRSA